jgi:hypothetical protein
MAGTVDRPRDDAVVAEAAATAGRATAVTSRDSDAARRSGRRWLGVSAVRRARPGGEAAAMVWRRADKNHGTRGP